MKLSWILLRRLFKYSVFITSSIEKKMYLDGDLNNNKIQPVFILGVPRSGTTLCYQMLSNHFDFLYVDNLVGLSRETPLMGLALSRLFFNDKPHNSFSSNYGKTIRDGLHAPNQEHVFWLKYRDILTNPVENIMSFPTHIKRDIQDIIHSAILKYQKPIIMKGAVVGNNIRLFSHLFPNAKYIVLKRNPLFTAQSLFKSLDHFKNFDHAWLEYLKPNSNIVNEKDIYRKISLYIYYLYDNIFKGLDMISAENYVNIDYEALGLNTKELLEQIINQLKLDVNKKKNGFLPSILPKNNIQIDRSKFNLLEKEINNISWTKFGIKQ